MEPVERLLRTDRIHLAVGNAQMEAVVRPCRIDRILALVCYVRQVPFLDFGFS